MNRRDAGFSLVEMAISIAISAVLMLATYAVVASVIKGDEESRVRVELQLEAASAMRKISDLLKMAGPTGSVSAGWASGDYPVFAPDQAGGGFPMGYEFLNQTFPQISPTSNPVYNNAVAALAPAGDRDGYNGPSNEMAFQLPRPTPFYFPGAVPPGKSENPIDDTGVPVNLAGQVTWGVNATLYNYYSTSTAVPGASIALADRQADVYAIVLVPTTSWERDAGGVAVAGPNQLELREYSAAPKRFLIRRSVLAYNVERIVFASSKGNSVGAYYLTGGVGTEFQDSSLGINQLRVTLWMWKNDMNKKQRSQIQAFRAKQSMTVNLRSVGQNQN